MPRSGLSVERHPSGCGWHVVHALSRVPFGFTVRLRVQAQEAAGALYATGVDFTVAAGAPLRAHPQWAQAAAVAARWKELARDCCHDGGHYSPYTYAMSGRCSGTGQPRPS